MSHESESDSGMIQMMNDAWKEEPDMRPNMKTVKHQLKAMTRGRSVNLMDHIMKMMEKYTTGLEQTITDRAKQLTDEVKKAEMLLYRMIPR